MAMTIDNKTRLFEIMNKINGDFLNETKAFAELRKSNKNLYNKTIDLESKIGDDILDLINTNIEKENFKFTNKKEKELVYLIILDLLLDRYLNKL